jgi:outer membrane receptor for ferrienterochelin and colicins
VSVNLEARLGEQLRLLAGVTYMEVFTETQGVRADQFFAPRWSGTFTASYQLPERWSVDLTGQAYGPMRLPTLQNDYRPDHSPAYTLVNIQVKKSVHDRLEVYGGVKNLLDFRPTDPLMRPFDPFDRTAGDTATNPNGHTFDTTYIYASLQGIRGYFGVRWVLG